METIVFEGYKQTDDDFKRGDTQHVGSRDRARLPPLSLSFSFMKTDSGGEVRLWILHILPPGFGFRLAVSSELSRVRRVSGRHVKEERSFQEVFGCKEGVSLGLGQVLSRVLSVIPCLEFAVRSRKV